MTKRRPVDFIVRRVWSMDVEYNECKTCGAKDGRAGTLINGECMNCHYTRKTGDACVHANLQRTADEIAMTFAIIKDRVAVGAA